MSEKHLLNRRVLNNICRACLGTQNLLPISKIRWEDVSLKDVLREFLKEELDCDSKMPAFICKSCTKNFYNFWFYLAQVKINSVVLKKSLANYKLQQAELKAEDEDKDDIKLEDNDSVHIDSDHNNDDNEFFNFTEWNDTEKKKDTQDTAEKNEKVSDEAIAETDKDLKDEIEALKMDIQKIRGNALVNVQVKKSSAKTSSSDNKDNMPKFDGAYKCVDCNAGFLTLQELGDHKVETKHRGSMYVCPYCEKKMNNHPRFEIHLRTHTKEKPNKCPQCGKGFNDKGDLYRHIRHVHMGLKAFKCDVCNMRFKRKHYLTDHQRTHTSTMSVCHYCGKSFQSVYKMYAHIRMHKQQEARAALATAEDGSQKDPYTCDICGKVLLTEYTLKAHKLLHGPRNFSCEICGKCFTTAGRLKGHKEFSHKEGKFPCEHCGKIFKEKGVMLRHIEQVHFGKKHKCEYCNKDFVYLSSMKMHLRIHTGDTQYQCKVCFKICLSKRHLDKHMRTHTGEKPYSCSYCDKKFSHASNMKDHERTHTGELSYRCALCSKGFGTSSALRKHMKSHNDNGTNNAPSVPNVGLNPINMQNIGLARATWECLLK